ncbi:iron permease [Trametes coccinea BRFM310]|uniref:Iron permease n=1 Tax=Trametes coccinea (strain BRFM310) TaxID=1353009 RepID=A0A1Y2IRQ4_TRAC3|nr:iron permease [Trametes coccinea BRFM310]
MADSPLELVPMQPVDVQDETDKAMDRTANEMMVTPKGERGFIFWMIFASTLLVEMLSALDLTAVSTALPTIVERLHGSDFIWAGGAYTIASTAVLPLVGGLVSGFGRKWVLIGFVFCFAVGSVFCGTARSMKMLIVGRAIQGLGSGGSLSCTEIIFADMVPLPERGKFQGIGAAVWALACAVGPPIGGALAGSGAWRWLFYMNLPLCALAAIAICMFLRNVVPEGGVIDKINDMDWPGNCIIITSTVLVFLGLTWGGLRFSWTAPQVLVPIILGAIGIVVFFVAEKVWLHGRTVPAFLFTNRTTLSGYLGTFFHGVVSLTAIYYLPVYLQASKDASALHSGIDMFGLSFSIPLFAIFTGVSIEVFNIYRPQNYIGWICTLVGFVLLSLLTPKSGPAEYIGFQIPLGVGVGILWLGTQYPVLAPLPVSDNAYALAFFVFVRNFAQSWGIVVGGAILQNVLTQKLPTSLTSKLPKGRDYAYQLIPNIRDMHEPQKTEVRVAFSQGTQLIWRVMIGLSAAGLLTCLLMREEEMKTEVDETWAVTEQKKGKKDAEDVHEHAVV